MSTVDPSAKVDTRNIEWKSNNVGSKLLQKMGWKDGQAVGKRQREESKNKTGNPDSDIKQVSSEGLRVVKRQTGLGIGAKATGLFNSENHQHVATFSSLLRDLNEVHPTEKKSKRSKKRMVSLPTNKLTNEKVRKAKFQEKTSDDMKCIFAGAVDFPVVVGSEKSSPPMKKRKISSKNKGDDRKKKNKSKSKKESRK